MKIKPEDLVLDRTNFPMLWVESLKAYIHLLPVTKIQYEYYLWDAPNPGLDQKWYDRVTAENKRISPHAITRDNYWQIFIGAILPSEAQHFAKWSDAQSGSAAYTLPTPEEWMAAYQFFKTQRDGNPFEAALGLSGLAPRARTILERLSSALPVPSSFAERLLLLGGMMEWVVRKGAGQPWLMCGYPSASFVSFGHHPDGGFYTPNRTAEDEHNRHRAYGFRLLRKKIP